MHVLERSFHKIEVTSGAVRKSRGYSRELMARPREFDVDEALDRATELFWTRGYEATSVQDLVDALGVNRASLYATFGDKGQLFAAVLRRYGEQVSDALLEALAPPAAGAEAVRAWFKVLIEKATQPRGPRGCLLLNAVSRLHHRARAAPGSCDGRGPVHHGPAAAGAGPGPGARRPGEHPDPGALLRRRGARPRGAGPRRGPTAGAGDGGGGRAPGAGAGARNAEARGAEAVARERRSEVGCWTGLPRPRSDS